MPHYDPPLKTVLTREPARIFAGRDSLSYYLYPGLLLLDGTSIPTKNEILRVDADGSIKEVNWSAYDFATIGRVVEFVLQMDYSTVLDDDSDESTTVPSPIPVTTRRKKVKRSKSRTSRKVVKYHDGDYQSKYDIDTDVEVAEAVGPFSSMQSFLVHHVCKDWMLNVEGYTMSNKTDANYSGPFEVVHLAIPLHIKVYIFASEHNFVLLRDVAAQKLVMLLSRIVPDAKSTTAICEAHQLLKDAGFRALSAEHSRIYEILEHFTANNLSLIREFAGSDAKALLERASQKLDDWNNSVREEIEDIREKYKEQAAKNAELERQVASLKEREERKAEFESETTERRSKSRSIIGSEKKPTRASTGRLDRTSRGKSRFSTETP